MARGAVRFKLRTAAMFIAMLGAILGCGGPLRAANLPDGGAPGTSGAARDWRASVRAFAAEHFKNPA
jgi:hypothetical protein